MEVRSKGELVKFLNILRQNVFSMSIYWNKPVVDFDVFCKLHEGFFNLRVYALNVNFSETDNEIDLSFLKKISVSRLVLSTNKTSKITLKNAFGNYLAYPINYGSNYNFSR